MNTESKNQKLPKRRHIELAGVVLVVLSLILASCAPATPATPTNLRSTPWWQPPWQPNRRQPSHPPPPPPLQPPMPAPPQPTANPNIPVAVLPTPVPGGPSLTANFNTVIRGGPGNNYVVYGTLLGGKTATPIGKSQDGTWWVVSVPPAPLGQGWVIASMATVTNRSQPAGSRSASGAAHDEYGPAWTERPARHALAEVYRAHGSRPAIPGLRYRRGRHDRSCARQE